MLNYLWLFQKILNLSRQINNKEITSKMLYYKDRNSIKINP